MYQFHNEQRVQRLLLEYETSETKKHLPQIVIQKNVSIKEMIAKCIIIRLCQPLFMDVHGKNTINFMSGNTHKYIP